jgi:hypothetical protein
VVLQAVVLQAVVLHAVVLNAVVLQPSLAVCERPKRCKER